MGDILNFIKNMNENTTISLIIAVVIIAILDIFSPILAYIVVKIFNLKKRKKEIKNNAFYIPLKSFFRVSGIYLAIIFLKPTFNLSDNTIDIVTKVYKIAVIITTAIGFANSITRKSRFIQRIKDRSEKDVDDVTTRFIVRGIRALIYTIAAFMVISELGYDLSWLITGLGLGSVVVTLAAQDTIKSLLGGFIIFTDKPFRIGDYIKFDKYEGIVEDISFRSTKLRTLENSIAQIPNAVISNSIVENLSKMTKRRFELDLELVLDTSIENLKRLEAGIEKELTLNESIVKESINISFNEITSNGLNLKVLCYVDIVDLYLFLKAKELINTQIINVVRKNGIDLAYDTKTIEIKK